MKLADIKPVDNVRAWKLVQHFIDQILGGKPTDPNLERAVRHLYYETNRNQLTQKDQEMLNTVLHYAKNISNRQLDIYS